MLNNYTRVRLMTDAYRSAGASAGEIGYIIEVYRNGQVEVEFSRPDGTTCAQIVAAPSDLQVAEPQPAVSEPALAAMPQ